MCVNELGDVVHSLDWCSKMAWLGRPYRRPAKVTHPTGFDVGDEASDEQITDLLKIVCLRQFYPFCSDSLALANTTERSPTSNRFDAAKYCGAVQRCGAEIKLNDT